MAIRDQVATAVLTHTTQACLAQHTRGYHTLYAQPSGCLYWREEVSGQTWDVLTGWSVKSYLHHGPPAPVAVIYRTGTGAIACDCPGCRADADRLMDWAADEASDLEPDLLEAVAAIPVGYFDDEPAEGARS